MQVTQLAGHASHWLAPWKKPELHEHVPAPPSTTALGSSQEVHRLGAVQVAQPARHTGTSQRSPVHSALHEQVQSAFCWPFTQLTVQSQEPDESHWPKVGLQLLLSHCTWQVVP